MLLPILHSSDFLQQKVLISCWLTQAQLAVQVAQFWTPKKDSGEEFGNCGFLKKSSISCGKRAIMLCPRNVIWPGDRSQQLMLASSAMITQKMYCTLSGVAKKWSLCGPFSTGPRRQYLPLPLNLVIYLTGFYRCMRTIGKNYLLSLLGAYGIDVIPSILVGLLTLCLRSVPWGLIAPGVSGGARG